MSGLAGLKASLRESPEDILTRILIERCELALAEYRRMQPQDAEKLTQNDPTIEKFVLLLRAEIMPKGNIPTTPAPAPAPTPAPAATPTPAPNAPSKPNAMTPNTPSEQTKATPEPTEEQMKAKINTHAPLNPRDKNNLVYINGELYQYASSYGEPIFWKTYFDGKEWKLQK